MNEARHYDHRFHAGNVGDVWKHVALIAALERARPRRVIDTHAGAGAYVLGPTGEHTEGIGKLSGVADPPAEVARYLALASGAFYPGSPRIARAVLGEDAELVLFELDDAVRAELSRNAGVKPRGGDGLAGMLETVTDETFVLVDPPYQDRREWETVPDAMAKAAARAPGARFLLWYPIKSYARPNAMHARLEKAGLSFSAFELLTSPLSSKKNRLNGSGVLFVRPPAGLLEAMGMLGAWLGPRLALAIPPHAAFWTVRAVGIG